LAVFSVNEMVVQTTIRFGNSRIANGRVAQLAEHTPEKRGVTGSTPVSTTIV
jgi:hypothetical protein